MPASSPATRPSRFWPSLLAIFLLALALRAANVAALDHTPLARLLLGDAIDLDLWAKKIVAGDFLSSCQGPFALPPGYPYFLALCDAALGPSPLSALAMQTLLGALACVLLALAGQAFFSARVGLLAALGLACYPPAIYFDGSIGSASLTGFLLTALLATLGRAWRVGRSGTWLAAGLLLGLLALAQDTLLLLVPAVLVGLWLGLAELPRARRLLGAAVLLTGVALVLAPVLFRPPFAAKRCFITYQLGQQLWRGNHPGADGFYPPLAASQKNWHFDSYDAAEQAARASADGRPLNLPAVSAYWAGRAARYALCQPGSVARLTLRKLWLFWNTREVGPMSSQYLAAEASPVLAWLDWVWHFGLLVPLAAAALALTWPRRRALSVWLLLILAVVASALPFCLSDAARLPVVPLLLPFAAAALLAAWDARRQPTWVALRGPLILALLALAFTAWPAVATTTVRANASFHVAIALQGAGDVASARQYYQHAIALNPQHDGAHVNLGQLEERDGHFQAALDHYQAAVDSNPDDAAARTNLCGMLVRAGRLAEAVKHGREAVRLDPRLLEAAYNLGQALLRQGYPGEAATYFEAVTNMRPEWATAWDQLGTARLHQNRPHDAIRAYQRALALDAHFDAARQNLAGAYHAAGNDDAAVEQYTLALSSNQATVHLNLGIVLLGQGKGDEALSHLRTAVTMVPKNPDAHRALGYALYRLKLYDDATKEYQLVLNLVPKDAEAQQALKLLDTLREPR